MSSIGSSRIIAARALFQQNRLAEAEEELRSILSSDPLDNHAHLLLAGLHFRMGRLAEAETEVLKVDPVDIDAIGLLAILQRAQHSPSSAAELFQRLIDLGHESADIWNNLGSCRLEMDDPISAGAAFKRAIELDRTVAHSYYNLGMALKLAGNSFETFSTFKRSTELDPSFFDNYVQLWQQMRQILNWQEGLPILESGLRRHPESTQMMVMLASTYGKVGRRDKAEELFRTAARIDAGAGPPYGHWLQEEGRFSDSIPVLHEVIRRDPLQAEAYYYLAVANCFDVAGRPLTDMVEPLLEDERVEREGRMFLHYTLAKIHDQQRDYEPAMREYDRANALAYQLYNSRVEHDGRAVESEHAALVQLYSYEAIQELRACGSHSETPIFIVGMIRTGTTLLDQILASHPKVKSAGEQPFWQVSAGRVNRRWIESGRNPEDLKELERRYLTVLRNATGGATRITDKMPTNFSHMGLMSVTFPRAKFIHIRRNPLDTCLSIYTTFLGRGTQFAYEKHNIVSYYKAYLRTMDYWRSVIPRDQMIEIDYEDLVSNKEGVLREVIAFCGLPWDGACLSHELSNSQVNTPSVWTARQAVNAKSVERWRRYEPWLGTLLELKDLNPRPTGIDLGAPS